MAGIDAQEAADILKGKQPKDAVNYRPSSQEEDEAWCGSCQSFENTGRNESPCALVAGTVFDNDVCDLYEAAPDEGRQDIVPREQEGAIIDEML